MYTWSNRCQHPTSPCAQAAQATAEQCPDAQLWFWVLAVVAGLFAFSKG